MKLLRMLACLAATTCLGTTPVLAQLRACPTGTIRVLSADSTAALCATAQVPPTKPQVEIPERLPLSNEPTGLAVFVNDSSNAPRPAGWAYSGSFAVLTDTTAPRSPPTTLRALYTGVPGGSSPGIREISFRPVSTLYLSAWLRFSPNFTGHPTSTNKLFHFFIGGSNRLYLMARGTGLGDLTPAIGLQGLAANYPVTGTNERGGNLTPNVGVALVSRTAWQRWELLAVANTPNHADGSVTLWLDGVRVCHYTNIAFTTDGSAFTIAQFSPTWGGIGGVAGPWSIDLDHTYVSGR